METELLLAPITALEIIGDHLVAGEGPNIVIYALENDTSQPAKCCRQILRNYNVHGIKEQQKLAPGVVEATTLAVFGGKGLVVVELTIQDSTVRLAELFPFCELHDWIWDLQWLKGSSETPSCLALALGHNSMALYDCTGQQILREVHCQEKCILYSAHLVGSSWDNLVLVAGTVFNQLVVWCAADPDDDTGRIKPRIRISGHKGVIFSICYSESKSILASASDDRSLRLWAVSNLRAPPDHVPCLLVCYGHQSRVWSVRLLDDYIISIGEDSACLVWNYQGQIVHSFRGHKGRGLRAVAVHEARGWVFTGGVDSGIRLWQLKGHSTNGSSLLQLSFPSPQRKGSPRAVKLVDVDHLLVMTDAGAVYTYNLTSKVWTLALEDASYQSYSLLAVSELASGGVLCAMGNLSGHVKIFPLSKPIRGKELKLYEGKVHHLSWVSWPEQSPDVCSLFASGPAGVLLWLQVSVCPLEEVTVAAQQCFLLPLCKQRWHTCATFLPQGELLLCGDRRGSLMLFPCRPALGVAKASQRGELGCSGSGVICSLPGLVFPMGGEAASCAEGPIALLFGLHGKLGVTSVTCHGDFVYSTGRDGCYRQLQVQGRQLRVLRKQKPYKGLEWLEELRFGPRGSLCVLGFHAAHFVLWSVSSNEKLLSIPCGGGHRSWSLTRSLSPQTFAYVKSGDVIVFQSSGVPDEQRVFKEPLHGRELTCLCHVGTLRTAGQAPVSILATGSEDNMVNILALAVQSHSVTQLTAIGDHISSVRALAVAENGTTQLETGSISTILFSAGGRAQIECYHLLLRPNHGSRSGMVCQLAHMASHRLDEQWDRMKNRHKLIKMDPETRYMSIAVLAYTEDAELPGPLLFLAAACSDGSVRLFLLLEGAQKLWLVAESFHHQHCVLKIQAFAHKTAGQRRRHFLGSAATDGSIAFWDITATVEQAAEAVKVESNERKLLALGTPVLTVQAHSCGVNSLHIQETADGHFLMASGSDDGSISLCVIGTNSKSTTAGAGVHVSRKLSRLCAHAAHVTGVHILHPDFLLSVSVDQRLTLWRLCEDGLSFVCSKFCHVADVASLECWEAEKQSYCSVICGQGLEVLRCVTPSEQRPIGQCHVQELLSTLQLPEPHLGCSRWVSSKMPFQPHFSQRARQSPAEASRPIAPLEATALLPSVTGTMIRGTALPTASVITHPGCAMRMGVAPASRKCQSHGRSKEEPAGGKSLGWLEKVGAAIKHQSKAAPKTSLIPRQNGIALPPIPRKGDKDFEKPGQKLPCLPACSSQVKGAPLGNDTMSPWMGPSQSEAAFHALFQPMVSFLHSVPFSAAAAGGTPGSCSFPPELGEKALAADGNRRRRAKLLQGRSKQKSRSRGLPRHFGSKWQGMTLPPVPSITNLNFSRNFTFSFFELPPHQSHEHWMQRQQLICLLMKQLK